MIRDAFELANADWGYIPLHQQSLAWGVSKKVKLSQRADNQVLLYWATKQCPIDGAAVARVRTDLWGRRNVAAPPGSDG